MSENEVTVQQLKNLMGELAMSKNKISDLEAEVDMEKKNYNHLVAQVKTVLEQNDMKNFRASGIQCIRVKRLSASCPKDLVEKEKFFDYLKERGDYESMITVNANSLSSYYKERLAEAEDPDFTIPGLGEPRYSESLQVRNSR